MRFFTLAAGVSATAHRNLMDKANAPEGLVHTYEMLKAPSSLSSISTRNLRAGPFGSASMDGTAASDYKVSVAIGKQTFLAIADTGSADFAVAGSPNFGCSTYYSGICNGPTSTANYGSGSWKGSVCQGPEVNFVGLKAGNAPFVSTTEQSGLFHCNEGKADSNNGIIGMSFSGLSTNNQPTLLDSVFSQNPDISKVISMQCCGYDGGEELGTGNLVVGGVDSSYHTGNFSFTPITQALWYCVDMSDLKFGDQSLMKGYSSSSSECETIVDSGTSGLQLAPDLYDAFMSQLPAGYSPDQCISDEFLQTFPDVTISLDGGVELTITPEHYTQPQPLSATGGLGPVSRAGLFGLANIFGTGITAGGAPAPSPPVSNCRSLYVMKAPAAKKGQVTPQNILGQVVMEAYYTVFDQENMRVGFAPIAGCGQNPPAAGSVVPLDTDCDSPGSNCGHPVTNGSDGTWDNLEKSWQDLGNWRWVILGAGGFFVLLLLYCMFTPPGTFRSVCMCKGRGTRRRQQPQQQAAFTSNLAYPLSPAVVATAPPCTPGVPPPGWQTIQDSESGRSYYINPATGRATWNMPPPRPLNPVNTVRRMHTIPLEDSPTSMAVTQQSAIAQV